MRKMTLNVPTESIVEFARIIEEHELDNTIVGLTEDEEIIVEIQYENNERQGVFELIELTEGEDDDEE
jgi:hypothetical protein